MFTIQHRRAPGHANLEQESKACLFAATKGATPALYRLIQQVARHGPAQGLQLKNQVTKQTSQHFLVPNLIIPDFFTFVHPLAPLV